MDDKNKINKIRIYLQDGRSFPTRFLLCVFETKMCGKRSLKMNQKYDDDAKPIHIIPKV